MTTATRTVNAEVTFAQLAAVNEGSIPVMSRDRMIPRKDQAALARKLFKALGVKGLSITTPNYSMASSVYVSVPRIERAPEDHQFDGTDYQNESYADMPEGVVAKQKHLAHWKACEKVSEILSRAFPKHDDRSDSMTDYFDFCWSVE